MKKLFYILLIFLLAACEDTNKPNVPKQYNKQPVKEKYSLLYGFDTQLGDEYAGALIADKEGNVYFTVNEDEQLAFVSLDQNGKLRWSTAWDDLFYDGVFNCNKKEWNQGGLNGSLAQDDQYLYAIVNSSLTPANNIFSIVVLKINKNDGKLVWAKRWNRKKFTVPASENSDLAYSLDVDNKYVYVTGTLGDNKALMLILDKNNGSFKYQGEFELSSIAKDNGTVVKAVGDDYILITGMSGNKNFLAKFFVKNPNKPELIWVKVLNTGYKICPDDMDVDKQGNIYLAFDVEGTSSKFIIAKLNERSDFVWMKIFPAQRSELNTTRVIKVIGDYIYVGGRASLRDLNNQSGDGLILKLDKETGELKDWYAYYTGNQESNTSMHIVESIAKTPDGFVIFGQVLGAPGNLSSYTGVWLTDKALVTSDSKMEIAQWATDVKLETIRESSIKNATSKYTHNKVRLLLPKDKVMTNAPDYDVFILKVENL